jgi:hypothetical protein
MLSILNFLSADSFLFYYITKQPQNKGVLAFSLYKFTVSGYNKFDYVVIIMRGRGTYEKDFSVPTGSANAYEPVFVFKAQGAPGK